MDRQAKGIAISLELEDPGFLGMKNHIAWYQSKSTRWGAAAPHLVDSLILDLPSPQALHLFAGRKQVIQLALGFDASILHYHNPVRATEGWAAVGYHQAGQPAVSSAALVQPFPQELLRIHV